MERDMERMESDVNDITWQVSPLSTVHEPLSQPRALAEGPVKFLLVSGATDEGRWGLVGAYWLSIDAERGGFIVSPNAIYTGTELAKSLRGAVERGWDAERIYAFWRNQVGMAGKVMIDPQQHADTLFQVARRVGAL
jgi:hypothetical protein